MIALAERATDLIATLTRLGEADAAVEAAAVVLATSLGAGGKILAAGNGGSAAETQHMTAEFLGRLHPDRERRPLAAVALHAETSTMTAVGNDYGFDEVFSRQVQALGRPEDVLVVFSTSGRSKNLVRAVEEADTLGMKTIAFLGGNESPLAAMCSNVLAVPSTRIQTIQECHLFLLHVVVERCEDLLGFTF